MPYTFSPSTLSILEECPRCFWLHFKKGIRRPNGIFPSLPSGMDRIFKEHFDSFAKRGELPPEIRQLKGYSIFHEPILKTWRNGLGGVQWKDDHGNMLRGAVDAILTHGEKLVVLDYKTRGYPVKEDTPQYYRAQMDMYNFLLRKNGYETEDYAYLLFYHPDKVLADGGILFHCDVVKVGVQVKNAQRVFDMALDVLGGGLPNAGKDCGYCAWLKKISEENL